MSQKSTARTGSEGDVELKEIRNIDARSGSSSCRSKRDIFGGPFGDSPYERAQDYVFIMFHNDDDTAGTSDDSQQEKDLYNLHHDYTEQLNVVRKQMNLLELPEGQETRQRCTITEILDDEPSSSKREERVQKKDISSQRLNSGQGYCISEVNTVEDYELTTIRPFSFNYNLQTESSSDVLQPDYSPPSKKVCQRLKTPRITSISEGSIPYHTKVGIHDSLFKEGSKPQEKSSSFVKKAQRQFTDNRQTQCTEEELREVKSIHYKDEECSVALDKFSILNLSFETESGSERQSPNSGPLFPKVIIETKNGQGEDESSLSPQSSKKCVSTSISKKDSCRKQSIKEILPLNSVRDSSDEEDSHTVIVTNRTIDTSDEKKKMPKRQDIPLERQTMWEELSRLRSGTDNRGKGDAESDPLKDFCKLNNYIGQMSQEMKLHEFMGKHSKKNSNRSDGTTKLTRYIRQYVNYKTEVDTMKAKKHNRHTLIGQRFVNMENTMLDSPDKLYQSENSLGSDEEGYGMSSSSSRNQTKGGFWERFCLCLCPGRSYDE